MIQLDKGKLFPFSSNPFGLVYKMTILFNHLISNEQLYLIGDIKLTY